jgi:7-carboxy-7-deazaguanine synthase
MGGIMLINNIFNSIDGEVNHFGQGMLTTFIRLQGCNLRCSYCDTPQAQNKDEFPFKDTRATGGPVPYKLTPSEIAQEVKKLYCGKVTITGGEPLEQRKDLIRLVSILNKTFGYDVPITIETNGSKSLFNISDLASWVVDYKLESSGMNDAMNEQAFAFLGPKDTVKFVIKDKTDFDDSVGFIRGFWKQPDFDYTPTFAFSPMFKSRKLFITPYALLNLLNGSFVPGHFKTALNIQLHKIIGLP